MLGELLIMVVFALVCGPAVGFGIGVGVELGGELRDWWYERRNVRHEQDDVISEETLSDVMGDRVGSRVTVKNEEIGR